MFSYNCLWTFFEIVFSEVDDSEIVYTHLTHLCEPSYF
jgi:hypothetical protein